MRKLPEEQDRLLKLLHQFEALEKKGILPEKNNINLFLVILSAFLGCILTGIAIFQNNTSILNIIIVFTLLASLAFSASFYNKKVGYYASCFAALCINIYVTFIHPQHYSGLITLFDGLTIFIFANQFSKAGFYISTLLLLVKTIGIYFYFPQTNQSLENLFAGGITMLAIGFIPVLINSIALVSRKAKIQEIRAQILALQNQDLMDSWAVFYKSDKTKEDVEQANEVVSSVYESPYEYEAKKEAPNHKFQDTNART